MALFGDVARDRLVGLIGGRIVRCEIRDRDPYGRAVSRCQAGATDLGSALALLPGCFRLSDPVYAFRSLGAAEPEDPGNSLLFGSLESLLFSSLLTAISFLFGLHACNTL